MSVRVHDERCRFVDAGAQMRRTLEDDADQSVMTFAAKKVLIDDRIPNQSESSVDHDVVARDREIRIRGVAPFASRGRSSPVIINSDITAAPADVPPMTAPAR